MQARGGGLRQGQLDFHAIQAGLHLGHHHGGCIGLRAGLEVKAALGRHVDDVAFQNGAHLHPPLLAAGQRVALADGPKPQGAPVVHHQLQAAEGRGQVAIFIEQALLADGFFLCAADAVAAAFIAILIAACACWVGARGRFCLKFGAYTVRPHGGGIFGAGAVAGQGGAVLGPEFIHALAQLLQAGNLMRGQWGAEGFAPGF